MLVSDTVGVLSIQDSLKNIMRQFSSSEPFLMIQAFENEQNRFDKPFYRIELEQKISVFV